MLDIFELEMKKVLRGDCLFRLSKRGDLEKEFGKPWFTPIVFVNYLLSWDFCIAIFFLKHMFNSKCLKILVNFFFWFFLK